MKTQASISRKPNVLLQRTILSFLFLFLTGPLSAQVQADFFGAPREGLAPLFVRFTDTSTGANEWNWTFFGGSPETATGPGPHWVVYYSAGSFDVRLMIEGGMTHKVFDTKYEIDYITVNEPEYDFGDAPPPYPTMKDDPGVIYRTVSQNCKLGSNIDGEEDGHPDWNALGDDNACEDDEDGITFSGIMQGFSCTVSVDFSDPGLATFDGTLDAWIDFDRDSVWEESEKIFDSVILTPGQIHDLYLNIPDTVMPGTAYARFVLTSGNPWVPISGIPLGEVEDYHVEILSSYDFGDAPFPYPTLLRDPGSIYRAAAFWMMLGQTDVDTEPNGQPNAFAMGDDNMDRDDEDGVVLETPWAGLLPHLYADAVVDFSCCTLLEKNGLLDAWIDYDRNGAWENDEQIFNSEILTPGSIHTLTFRVPATAEPGTTFARYVLTSQDPADTNSSGIPYGEVEDHLAYILPIYDFGDAPPPYPTLRNDPGSIYRACFGGRFSLGNEVDGELDGQPDENAMGDDNSQTDDEDGVTIYFLTAGEQGTAYIRFPDLGFEDPNGLLDAWIDFDQNGAWEENEKVIDSYQLIPIVGTIGVTFDVPSTAVPGFTFGRFVLTADTAVHPNGTPWGEVEDYQIQVLASSGVNQEGNIIPSAFSLEQNCPNPFNPTTQIKYGVKEPCQVNLVIYNLNGQLVNEAVHSYQQPGRYSINLNMSDRPSGIYFYRIQMGNFQAVKKMVKIE